MKSGHPYKLSKIVDGKPPEFPYSEVPEPPEGYTWDDVAYVIGGYGWKARFIGKDGYIITGDKDSKTQYNLYNERLKMGNNWVPYHAGEEKPYNCGPCHTTGYKSEGHQDDLEGIVGTWALPGIQCERCHGPGSNHVESPYEYPMKVDRSAELCGACHSRGGVEKVDAKGGFIKHHEQYEELFQSKHRVLDCVDCHNPHAGVLYAERKGIEPVRTPCQNCHFKEAEFQAVELHKDYECTSCHMPYIVKSALANTDMKTGDIRTHLFAINPYADAQFTEDGKYSMPYITLEYSCQLCHQEGGGAKPRTIEELREVAIGYHEPR